MRRGPLLLSIVLLAVGCGGAPPRADLGRLYDRLAKDHEGHRNPVIVIPGILGSRLVHEPSGQVVWGAFGGGAADPDVPAEARRVALPMRAGVPLAELTDDVRPDGVLDRLKVELLGLPLQLSAYVNILGTLGVGGYRDELLGMSGAIDYGDDHFTCFQFDYDWRRDNAENAARLLRFIALKQADVTRELERRAGGPLARPVKFDIVAHSMGGLVTRYMLRYGDQPLPATGTPRLTWAGAKHVERVILVATPSAGSANALLQLVDGITFSRLLPSYPAALLGTMPSIYQLLPRARHQALTRAGVPLDPLDPAVWERYGWGLVDPAADATLRALLPGAVDAAERGRIAREHLGRCLAAARQLHAALDVRAAPPAGTTLTLFAGDAVETTAGIAVDPDSGRPAVSRSEPGDGTVTRASALMDERIGGTFRRQLVSPVRWRQVTFLYSDHLGLTRDPTFTDNVLYLLLEDPRE